MTLADRREEGARTIMPRRALISVDDRSGLVDFVQRLIALEFDVAASAANAAFLAEQGMAVRVMENEPDAGEVDLVVVNLRSPAGVTFDEVLASADLERAALLREAATRYGRVIVVVDPDDYAMVVKSLLRGGEVPLSQRRALAQRALGALARHDALLARDASCFDDEGHPRSTPGIFTLVEGRTAELRFGDNRWQTATLYAQKGAPRGTLPQAIMYGLGEGEVPSAGQLRDAARARDLVAEIASPASAVLGRGHAVSVVAARTIAAAVREALRGARPGLSAPLLACNAPVDAETAAILAQAGLGTIVVPSLHPDAVEVLQARPGPCVIALRAMPSPTRAGFESTIVDAAVVVQARDATADGEVVRGRVVSQRRPTEKQLRALEFAWKVAKHALSDAVVIAREDDDGTLRTIAIAGGAPSRRSALELAFSLAGPAADGAVLASDGPIEERADMELVVGRGVLAAVHPGNTHDAQNLVDVAHILAAIATGVSHLKG
jgi:phosphoribosylaminoimidazolecarboxamide formyltransferase/IMP cyclohydrolase